MGGVFFFPKHRRETVKTDYKKIIVFTTRGSSRDVADAVARCNAYVSLHEKEHALIDWQEMSSPDGRREIQTVWCADPFNINLSCLADLVLGILCLQTTHFKLTSCQVLRSVWM